MNKMISFTVEPIKLAKMQLEDETLNGCREQALKNKEGHTQIVTGMPS